MSYEVCIKDNFSAAHRVKGYRGKCDNVHGHNWEVEVAVTADRLDKNDMVIDFTLIQGRLGMVLKKLDHSYLNGIAFFKNRNATAENVAYYIFSKMNSFLKSKKNIVLKEVCVSEMNNSIAKYTNEK